MPLSTPECNDSLDIDKAEFREERAAVLISDTKHKEKNSELMLAKSFDVKNFSTFKCLLRVTSLAQKFIKKCKGIRDPEKELNDAGFIEKIKKL